jgi:hypothetical protein
MTSKEDVFKAEKSWPESLHWLKPSASKEAAALGTLASSPA